MHYSTPLIAHASTHSAQALHNLLLAWYGDFFTVCFAIEGAAQVCARGVRLWNRALGRMKLRLVANIKKSQSNSSAQLPQLTAK